MVTIKIQNKKSTKMIAHRGVSKLEKENTMAAFIVGGNRSYFGIETDVHVTKDDKFIIIHDDTTGRVADRCISVENSDYADLRKINIKDIDSECCRIDLKMPNLTEYITICQKYGKVAVLELKNKIEKYQINAIIKEVEALDYLQNTIFISFSFDNLVFVKNIIPDQKVQFLTFDAKGIISKIKPYNMDLGILYKVVTPELVEECHKNGIEINCWTVDNSEDAMRLIEYGVDYITSNILE